MKYEYYLDQIISFEKNFSKFVFASTIQNLSFDSFNLDEFFVKMKKPNNHDTKDNFYQNFLVV